MGRCPYATVEINLPLRILSSSLPHRHPPGRAKGHHSNRVAFSQQRNGEDGAEAAQLIQPNSGLIGGAAAAWPLGVRAQQSDRVRRIGVLMAFAESDHGAQSWVAAFREELGKLGWTEGRNIEIN